MKKRTLPLILLLAIGFIFSCKKKENKEDVDCSGVTYSATVGPIIASHCATSGCHAAGSTNGPGALTNYQQVKASASSVRSSVEVGRMPKNSSLTSAQKSNILCWIDAGAPNN